MSRARLSSASNGSSVGCIVIAPVHIHSLSQLVELGLHAVQHRQNLLGDLARQRVVWLCGHEGKIGWPDFGAAVEDHGANVGGASIKKQRGLLRLTVG
jgi:hypothetical protein